VASRCSASGWNFTSVNSISFCKVDCALVMWFSSRQSCSSIDPSSLGLRYMTNQQWSKVCNDNPRLTWRSRKSHRGKDEAICHESCPDERKNEKLIVTSRATSITECCRYCSWYCGCLVLPDANAVMSYLKIVASAPPLMTQLIFQIRMSKRVSLTNIRSDLKRRTPPPWHLP
jgi:hypothetical protein